MLERMGRSRTSTRRKEREEGDWTRPIGGRSAELDKYTHPFIEQHPSVHNIFSSQVAPDIVNIQDELVIGSEQSRHSSPLS